MAFTDKTRVNEFAQKKSICVMACHIDESSADEFATAGNFVIANLPPEAVILDAYVHTIAASNAGAITLGTTEGGTEILSAGDSATPGKSGTFTGQSVTGTGVPVYMSTAANVTPANIGDFVVVIDYLEYEKNTGEYTRFL